MEKPIDPNRPDSLTWPPGAKFVMDVYNEWERKRYWLDGVKPMTSLIWYALAYDRRFALWAIPKLLRALPSLVFGVAPGAEDPRAELAQELEDADQEAWAAQYEADPDFRAQFNADLAQALAPPPEESLMADQFAFGLGADPVAMGDRVRDQVTRPCMRLLSVVPLSRGPKWFSLAIPTSREPRPCPAEPPISIPAPGPGAATLPKPGARTWEELFRNPDKFAHDRTLTFAASTMTTPGSRPAGATSTSLSGGCAEVKTGRTLGVAAARRLAPRLLSRL